LLTPRRSNIILVLAAAILLPVLTAHAMPLVFTPTDSLVLAEAASLAIAAIALNLLTGYAGQISLGHAALLGVGAFASGLVTSKLGLPMWIGLPAAAVVAGLVALLIGFPALRLRGLYLAMVTIAFGFAMYDSILRQDLLTGGSAGVELPRRIWRSTQFSDQSVMLAVALTVLVVVWLLDANVTRSRFGRALRVIRENEAVAQAFGVNVARHKLLAFVISGALAGVGGALWGHSVGFVNSESFPFDLSLALIIMIVVGGLGSRAGAVISAFAFSLFPTLLHNIPWLAGLEGMVGAFFLMYTVARHPGGFAEIISEAQEKRREARRTKAALELQEDGMVVIPGLPRMAATATTGATHAPGRPVLEVRDVTVRFGGLVAVNGAGLTVPEGKIVGLIGPNGAGKTTLFNTISGLIRPTEGSIRLLGEDISQLPAYERAARGLARTFQQVGLARDQSVLDNLLLAQHLAAGYGSARALAYTPRVAAAEAQMEARAREALSVLGFEGRESVAVKRLSGGQQRILEMGCALLTDPQLLMLDEPSAGMAPGAVENLAERLNDLRDNLGRTVLLIEHNLPLVLDVCDEIYVLDFGQVLASGTPEEIVSNEAVIGAYLGEAVA
jgi:ABC-type branched-subunit amino acid transport system ATPase component/ABC-type branched-subunit amino acid transport system permease subunit